MGKAPENSFLLKGVSAIITEDPSRRVLSNCDILVEGGRISKLGRGLKGKNCISGKGKLLMPGLVNCHTHVPMSIMRGVGDDLALHDWLFTKIFPLEGKFTKETHRAGAALGALELIETGTVAALDHYLDPLATEKAYSDSGLRVFCAQNIYDGKTGSGKWLSLAEKAAKRNRPGKKVKFLPAAHSIYTCSDETLLKAFGIAKKYETQFSIHASETRKEVADCELSERKCRPVELLSRLGILDRRTVLAHCGWISKGEARLIGESGSTVAHCPVSNMKLATGGFAPLPELSSFNTNLTLGTDGAVSNNSLDLFETMKMAALIHKQHRWDPTIIPAQSALDYATLCGSRFLGLDSGSIEEGKLADFIMLDLRSVRLRPVVNPISSVVYSATGDTVSDTVVGGEFLKRDGKVLSLDRERVFESAEQELARLCDRAGISKGFSL